MLDVHSDQLLLNVEPTDLAATVVEGARATGWLVNNQYIVQFDYGGTSGRHRVAMGPQLGVRIMISGFDATTIRSAYGSVADEYAASFGDDLANLELDRRILNVIADHSAGVGPVLDVGCGPAQVSGYLLGRQAEAVGIDFTPAMLAVARDVFPFCGLRLATYAHYPFGQVRLPVSWPSTCSNMCVVPISRRRCARCGACLRTMGCSRPRSMRATVSSRSVP